jgi:hypothetical protein
MFEVKARMIVRESQTRGALESFFDPFTTGLLKLAALVQKHPFISLAVFCALFLLIFRFAYRGR